MLPNHTTGSIRVDGGEEETQLSQDLVSDPEDGVSSKGKLIAPEEISQGHAGEIAKNSEQHSYDSNGNTSQLLGTASRRRQTYNSSGARQANVLRHHNLMSYGSGPTSRPSTPQYYYKGPAPFDSSSQRMMVGTTSPSTSRAFRPLPRRESQSSMASRLKGDGMRSRAQTFEHPTSNTATYARATDAFRMKQHDRIEYDGVTDMRPIMPGTPGSKTQSEKAGTSWDGRFSPSTTSGDRGISGSDTYDDRSPLIKDSVVKNTSLDNKHEGFQQSHNDDQPSRLWPQGIIEGQNTATHAFSEERKRYKDLKAKYDVLERENEALKRCVAEKSKQIEGEEAQQNFWVGQISALSKSQEEKVQELEKPVDNLKSIITAKNEEKEDLIARHQRQQEELTVKLKAAHHKELQPQGREIDVLSEKTHTDADKDEERESIVDFQARRINSLKGEYARLYTKANNLFKGWPELRRENSELRHKLTILNNESVIRYDEAAKLWETERQSLLNKLSQYSDENDNSAKALREDLVETIKQYKAHMPANDPDRYTIKGLRMKVERLEKMFEEVNHERRNAYYRIKILQDENEGLEEKIKELKPNQQPAILGDLPAPGTRPRILRSFDSVEAVAHQKQVIRESREQQKQTRKESKLAQELIDEARKWKLGSQYARLQQGSRVYLKQTPWQRWDGDDWLEQAADPEQVEIGERLKKTNVLR